MSPIEIEVIITSRSFDNAKLASEKLQRKVIPIELDITDDRSIDRAIKTLHQKIERLDVLIDNAGVYPDIGFTTEAAQFMD
ncbi:SDR family NAD(P)-dependent oxidoreductase [Nostoc sp. DedQUE07]|uniref:SDR family NAD(P)-dependent oxidoreductase n=1 Tax=Nostoc sp. DedQUE07 TaxID=3075392 RepID=UPI002AD30166|nr:SDR family NAD(P)-dependent oxidoreductase [Nostoc sp. DedQUE07]MDZ8129750.1 SDR family NAD(P)-dependent oxidoreductase [Nostoc sp. DedQUE07]